MRLKLTPESIIASRFSEKKRFFLPKRTFSGFFCKYAAEKLEIPVFRAILGDVICEHNIRTH